MSDNADSGAITVKRKRGRPATKKSDPDNQDGAVRPVVLLIQQDPKAAGEAVENGDKELPQPVSEPTPMPERKKGRRKVEKQATPPAEVAPAVQVAPRNDSAERAQPVSIVEAPEANEQPEEAAPPAPPAALPTKRGRGRPKKK